MNVFYIIIFYNWIKENLDIDILYCIFIFGVKVVFGYFMVKLIIKLINVVVEIVNNDLDVCYCFKIVFILNFFVFFG